jgi:hypothetical protein
MIAQFRSTFSSPRNCTENQAWRACARVPESQTSPSQTAAGTRHVPFFFFVPMRVSHCTLDTSFRRCS